jgi:hypothetical protein
VGVSARGRLRARSHSDVPILKGQGQALAARPRGDEGEEGALHLVPGPTKVPVLGRGGRVHLFEGAAGEGLDAAVGRDEAAADLGELVPGAHLESPLRRVDHDLRRPCIGAPPGAAQRGVRREEAVRRQPVQRRGERLRADLSLGVGRPAAERVARPDDAAVRPDRHDHLRADVRLAGARHSLCGVDRDDGRLRLALDPHRAQPGRPRLRRRRPLSRSDRDDSKTKRGSENKPIHGKCLLRVPGGTLGLGQPPARIGSSHRAALERSHSRTLARRQRDSTSCFG